MKQKLFTFTLITVICMGGLSGPAAAIDGPVFTGIGDLPGGDTASSASDISGDGTTVVGWGISGAGPEAFRWSWSDGIQGLGDLPGSQFYSWAIGVSEDGSVIVGGSHSAFRTEGGQALAGIEAFRWTEDEGMVGLGDLPGGPFASIAYDVAGDGSVIVGAGDYIFWSDQPGLGLSPWGIGTSEAFLWTDETDMVGLGDLPGGTIDSRAHGVSADGTVVVGHSGIPAQEAFRWTESTGMVGLGDLTGEGTFSAALAVSADGDTVVGQAVSLDGPEAFRWTEATGMVGLGDLPGGRHGSAATSVSADGAIVVGNGNSDLGPEPFLWTELQGMRRLLDVLRNDYGLDAGEWLLQRVFGVSDDGLVIAGSGINPDGNREAYVVCLRDKCFEEDADGDGITDDLDNCTLVANPAQRDTDNDGYGNFCDPDFDNNLIVDASDLAYLKTKFFTADADADLNGDNVVNAADLAILQSMFFLPPGPSGLVP